MKILIASLVAINYFQWEAFAQSPEEPRETNKVESENVLKLSGAALDARLIELFDTHGFTGEIESSLTQRLGRPINNKLAELGKLLFFDAGLGLRADNSCAGCHSPTHSFGDTQPIAIGVLNGEPLKTGMPFESIVGESRTGPRNQRRTPTVINTAFYPKMMWNGRFAVNPDPHDPDKPELGDPFDNSFGFSFPAPEGANAPGGLGLFPAEDKELSHLLVPQAHIPFTELPEMAGFHAITGFASSPRFQAKVKRFHSPQQPLLRPKQFEIKEAPEATIKRLNLPQSGNQQKLRVSPMDQLKKSSGGLETGDHGQAEFGDFDDGFGSAIPSNDFTNTRNQPIRQAVLEIINHTPGPNEVWPPHNAGPFNPPAGKSKYRALFRELFPHLAETLEQDKEGSTGLEQDVDDITMRMVAQAIAEFEITLTFANAPLDEFAREPIKNKDAMTPEQKRGAVIFFGKANCVSCHAVRGRSNEMFSDFANRVIGVPQVSPRFGKDEATGKLLGNVLFRDLLGELNETDGFQDFGLEDITDDIKDRYKFRTAPLRNLKFQRAFFHNGAFKDLRSAIEHHLDVEHSLKNYGAKAAEHIPADLIYRGDANAKIIERLDPKIRDSIRLSPTELDLLTIFVNDALLDPRATPEALKKFIPHETVADENNQPKEQLRKIMPTGVPLQTFIFK